MKKTILPFLIALITGCSNFTVDDARSDPASIFNAFWSDMDKHYAYFEYKRIDWDSVKVSCQSKINNDTDDETLLDYFQEILNLLRDGHLNVWNQERYLYYDYRDNNAPTPNWISHDALISYLADTTQVNNTLYYGRIRDANIGYLYIRNFWGSPSDYDRIDEIITGFSDTKGMIIDVRNNGGGDSQNAEKIASRFADSSRLSMKFRRKNGPGHGDFTQWENHYIRPEGNAYRKKVCVLINQTSFSSAEMFALFMKVIPQVTLVGDTTGGGGGNPITRELPNGWQYRFSTSQEVTPDMKQTENNGVYPDVAIWLTENEYDNKVDAILEKAIEVLK